MDETLQELEREDICWISPDEMPDGEKHNFFDTGEMLKISKGHQEKDHEEGQQENRS